jgi:hypothetical protein
VIGSLLDSSPLDAQDAAAPALVTDHSHLGELQCLLRKLLPITGKSPSTEKDALKINFSLLR